MVRANIGQQIRALGLLIAVLVPFACRNPSALPPLDEMRKQAIEKEIESQMREGFDQIRIGEVMSNLDRYDSLGPSFCVAPGRDTVFHYEDLRANAFESAQLMDSLSSEWLTLKAHALSEDVATFDGTVHHFAITRPWTINQPATRDTSIVTAIASGTLVRRGDRWKIVGTQSEDLTK